MRNALTYRSLEADEADDVLDLLDLWPFRDGRRGREFFSRSMRSDPRFAPENFWVAEQDGVIAAPPDLHGRLMGFRKS